jgi:hypothetical protein
MAKKHYMYYVFPIFVLIFVILSFTGVIMLINKNDVDTDFIHIGNNIYCNKYNNDVTACINDCNCGWCTTSIILSNNKNANCLPALYYDSKNNPVCDLSSWTSSMNPSLDEFNCKINILHISFVESLFLQCIFFGGISTIIIFYFLVRKIYFLFCGFRVRYLNDV